jgi:hypothetical protein
MEAGVWAGGVISVLFYDVPVEPTAQHVLVTDDELIVELTDGRTICVPIGWYSRLSRSTRVERNHWELNGGGFGIHWPDLDEDIRVGGLLEGRKSGESQTSLRRWLESRLAK